MSGNIFGNGNRTGTKRVIAEGKYDNHEMKIIANPNKLTRSTKA